MDRSKVVGIPEGMGMGMGIGMGGVGVLHGSPRFHLRPTPFGIDVVNKHGRRRKKLELGYGGGKIRIRNRIRYGDNLKLGVWNWNWKRDRNTIIAGPLSCKAMRQDGDGVVVYEGVYGPWTIHPSDVREVILYRSGLVTSAASFVLASSSAFVPGESLVSQHLDVLFSLGVGGLGLSLYLIHIYVAEIKRFLQALWGLGVIGCFVTYVGVAQPAHQGLVQYVVDHPAALWLVGPLFAALTGLVFKEGLCYGKLEAGLLTFIIPTLLLGHLVGVMDNGVKLSLLGVWMALFTIFAVRKFTQPVKDDIGDKSVFMFNALPEEEKAALLEKIEQQKF